MPPPRDVQELAKLAKLYLELWRIAEEESNLLLSVYASWRRGETKLLDLLDDEILRSHFERAQRPPVKPGNRQRWRNVIRAIIETETRIMIAATRIPYGGAPFTRRPPPVPQVQPIYVSPTEARKRAKAGMAARARIIGRAAPQLHPDQFGAR